MQFNTYMSAGAHIAAALVNDPMADVAAVGVDRSAFPTILEMVRQCTDGLPGGGAEGARRAVSAFGPFAPDIAASAFRQALAHV